MSDQEYVDDLKMAFTRGEINALDKVVARLDEALVACEDDWELGEGLDLAIRIVKNLK
jgi:hypothetical protein